MDILEDNKKHVLAYKVKVPNPIFESIKVPSSDADETETLVCVYDHSCLPFNYRKQLKKLVLGKEAFYSVYLVKPTLKDKNKVLKKKHGFFSKFDLVVGRQCIIVAYLKEFINWIKSFG